MTVDEAKAKLFPLFGDDDVRDAVATIIQDRLDVCRDRLAITKGSFYERAANLIEAGGQAEACEELITIFLQLRQDVLEKQETQSPSDGEEQE